MKQILFLTIGLQSLSFATDIVNSPNNSGEENISIIAKLPLEDPSLAWMKRTLDNETMLLLKKDPIWFNKFLNTLSLFGWSAVRDVTLDKGHHDQKQAIKNLMENIHRKTEFYEEHFAGMVFSEVANKLKKMNVYTVESAVETAKDEITFYLQKILKLNQKEVDFNSYQYLGRFRNFNNKSFNFVEVIFLLKSDTNEITAVEKEIGVELNSVDFCIAEILRNRLFLEKIEALGVSLISKDELTNDPLSLDKDKMVKDQMFGDHSWEEQQKIKNEILSLLKNKNLK